MERTVICKEKTFAQMAFFGNQWTNLPAQLKCERSAPDNEKDRQWEPLLNITC